jgi:hypothetical protein
VFSPDYLGGKIILEDAWIWSYHFVGAQKQFISPHLLFTASFYGDSLSLPGWQCNTLVCLTLLDLHLSPRAEAFKICSLQPWSLVGDFQGWRLLEILQAYFRYNEVGKYTFGILQLNYLASSSSCVIGYGLIFIIDHNNNFNTFPVCFIF